MGVGNGSRSQDFVGTAIMILKTFSAEYGIKSFSKSCDGDKKVMGGEPPVARRTAATFSSK